jgi:hypothetical protein
MLLEALEGRERLWNSGQVALADGGQKEAIAVFGYLDRQRFGCLKGLCVLAAFEQVAYAADFELHT